MMVNYTKNPVDYSVMMQALRSPQSRHLVPCKAYRPVVDCFDGVTDNEDTLVIAYDMFTCVPVSLQPWALSKLLVKCFEYFSLLPSNCRSEIQRTEGYDALISDVYGPMREYSRLSVFTADRNVERLASIGTAPLESIEEEVLGWCRMDSYALRTVDNDIQLLLSCEQVIQAANEVCGGRQSKVINDAFVRAMNGIDNCFDISVDDEGNLEADYSLLATFPMLRPHMSTELKIDLYASWIESWIYQLPPVARMERGIDW